MHRFNPDNRHRLLSEARYKLLPPEQVLDLLPLRDDAIVGDIGCGPGFFTLPLAARLSSGRVYAADIAPVMLQAVQERAEEAGLANIQTLLSDESSVPLDAASLDGALLALVYHEFEDRIAYLSLIARLVRPGGWLAVLEWERRENPVGGPPLDHRIPPDEAAMEIATAGWQMVGRHSLGDWLYLLVARRAS